MSKYSDFSLLLSDSKTTPEDFADRAKYIVYLLKFVDHDLYILTKSKLPSGMSPLSDGDKHPRDSAILLISRMVRMIRRAQRIQRWIVELVSDLDF